MATTTNFGWETPDDTDLVKDGAAAIRTALGGVDTSFVDLKGGTTGQVLSKASNTDLDFSWVAQDDSNAIQNALLTTTGDTIYASGASTPARLGIGSTGQVLTVSGGVPTWATPAGGSTFSGASVFNSTNQSHSSGADLTPSFNSENFDTDGYHDNSTNNSRLTVPTGKTGYFIVNAWLGWSNNSSSHRVIQFIKNGAAQVSRLSVAAANGGDTYANLTDILYLTAGDYITLQLYQASGSTLTIQSGSDDIGFSMTYLGA